jgi:hypothetical protein
MDKAVRVQDKGGLTREVQLVTEAIVGRQNKNIAQPGIICKWGN